PRNFIGGGYHPRGLRALAENGPTTKQQSRRDYSPWEDSKTAWTAGNQIAQPPSQSDQKASCARISVKPPPHAASGAAVGVLKATDISEDCQWLRRKYRLKPTAKASLFPPHVPR